MGRLANACKTMVCVGLLWMVLGARITHPLRVSHLPRRVTVPLGRMVTACKVMVCVGLTWVVFARITRPLFAFEQDKNLS
jgi:hypothetical protein